MHRLRRGIVVLLLIQSLAVAQDKVENNAGAPAEQYKAIVKEFNVSANANWNATTDEERQRIVAQIENLPLRLLELVEKHPKDPIALEALTQAVWQVNTTPWPVELVGEDSARSKAFELLQRDHIGSDKIGPLCQRISYGFCKEYESFLRSVVAKNPHEAVQATAYLSLAHFLNHRSLRVELCKEQPELAKEFTGLYGVEYLAVLRRQDSEKVVREVEALLEQAAKK